MQGFPVDSVLWVVGLSTTILFLQQLPRTTALGVEKGKKNEHHAEYCQHEVFEGRCDNNHVLFITRAQYGRMRLGKCVKTDFGFVGCSNDVTGILDKKCSGYHKCDITIADPNFDNLRPPCNEEFKNHLEVWYECVPVHYPKAGSCDIHLRTPLPVPEPQSESGSRSAEALISGSFTTSMNEGYLPSSIGEDTGCGSELSPWVIRVSKGQRIQITIYDFEIQNGGSSSNDQPQNSLICYKYGVLLEPHHRKSIDICAGNQREMLTYDSTGDTVHLTISRPGHSYMVKYKALGCPEVPSTAEMWFRREKNTLDVGCYNTDQEWHLSCKDTDWIGELGNCTVAKQGSKGKQAPSSVGSGGEFVLPPGLMIGVISVVAVCISLAIVIIGLICIKRVKYSGQKTSTTSSTDDNLHHAMQLNACPTTKLTPNTAADYSLKFNEDSYSHIFIPNQDCPLHSQAIYACKQHLSPHRGDATMTGGGSRHSYGVLHPLEHATIHEHIGSSQVGNQATLPHHHTTTTTSSSGAVPNIEMGSMPSQQQHHHHQIMGEIGTLKQEEYYQIRANNLQNQQQQQQQQPDLL